MYNWELSRGYVVFSASRLFHVRPWPRLISPEIISSVVGTCYDFNRKKNILRYYEYIIAAI